MKRKSTFLTLIICFLLQHCKESTKQEKGSTLSIEKGHEYIDTGIYAVLPYDTSQYWIFAKATAASLTNDEIIEIESLLRKCIDEYNIQQNIQFDSIIKKHSKDDLKKSNFVIDLKRYKRQYIAVVNDKGQKVVWVNCFCNTWNNNWRKNLISVFDGGNCYSA